MHLIILNKFSRIIKEKQNEMKRGKKKLEYFSSMGFFVCFISYGSQAPVCCFVECMFCYYYILASVLSIEMFLFNIGESRLRLVKNSFLRLLLMLLDRAGLRRTTMHNIIFVFIFIRCL